MNSDGLKPANPRKSWAAQYRQNANNTLKTTSRQNQQTGYKGGPSKGTNLPPKASLVPNTQAFTDRYTIPTLLARYVVTGGLIDVDGFDLHAFVYTPSTRLRCRMNVLFEADGGVADGPVFLVVPNWRIMNMGRNPYSGRESPLQQLYPEATPSIQPFNSGVVGAAGTAPLPDSFTLDNAGELVRLDIHFDNGQFNVLTYAPAGVNAYLITSWEPNVPIGQAELASFYRDCKVVYGNVPLIQKGVVP